MQIRAKSPVALVAVLVWLAPASLGQARVQSIAEVLAKANVSGSLIYSSSSLCRSGPFRYPSPPELQPAIYRGSAVDTLREMFANDPKMNVTQDSDGFVRMVEADASRDLLDLNIHHVQFDLSRFGPVAFGGPNVELEKILTTPEVHNFKKEHNLGPFTGFRMPGDAASYTRYVPGELSNVKVSQALDYILHTFPGYWIYGNCLNADGEHEAFFWFVRAN